MPELKHHFRAGKMNKDLDERLVPDGEYRDALNVEVASSDGAHVGTIQNVLGNTQKSFISQFGQKCVGSIAHGKGDFIIWFIEGGVISGEGRDYIVQYIPGSNTVKPILVDNYQCRRVTSSQISTTALNVVSPGTVRIGMTVQAYTGAGVAYYPDNVTVTNISGNVITTSAAPTINPPSGTNVTFKAERVLKFTGQPITAVNIIDGLLFWTDGTNEPKKINIKRAALGTPDILQHSKHYVQGSVATTILNSPRLYIRERDITVIKQNPKYAPILDMSNTKRQNLNGGDIVVEGIIDRSFIYSSGSNAGEQFPPGTAVTIEFEDSDPDFTPGDVLILESADDNNDGRPDHTVRLEIVQYNGGDLFQTTLLSITDEVGVDDRQWLAKLEQEKPLFEFKFPRFGYRYKYEDGEYSAFSPWSEIAFLPDSFDYNPNQGYNLGMKNQLRALIIKEFNKDWATANQRTPDGVIEIDILYKESTNNNVYTVQTLKKKGKKNLSDPEWTSDQLVIESELIYAAVPANQSLRPWDNVPLNAKAQEITANRIIYGNYTQNLSMVNNQGPFTPSLAGFNIVPNTGLTLDTGEPGKSIKSQRTYQLGVVYRDKFGRETPVFTNKTATKTLAKSASTEYNQIKATLGGIPPDFVDTFKFYVKETSNEYYNLAMDRYYLAEDGNVWLSFPSSERNKIDDETFLILKKRHSTDVFVEEDARYKVIAIKNEAPLFLKEKKVSFGELENPSGNTFEVSGYPQSDFNFTHIDKDDFDDSTLSDTTSMSNLVLRLRGVSSVSKWYEINSISLSGNKYVITHEKMGAEVDVITGGSTASTTKKKELSLEIAEITTKNKPEFEGRFFVKIYRDAALESNILSFGLVQDYTVVSSRNIPYLTGGKRGRSFWRDTWMDATIGGRSGGKWFIDKIGAETCCDANSEGGGNGIPDGGNRMDISFTGVWADPKKNFDVGVNCHHEEKDFVEYLNKRGSLFKFGNDPDVTIYEITNIREVKRIRQYEPRKWKSRFSDGSNKRKRFELTVTPNIGSGPSGYNPIQDGQWVYDNSLQGDTMEFLEPYFEEDSFTTSNPAIWETEPKEDVGLDIYYEISNAIPVTQHNDTHTLEWFNCYSFGNGVESNRIRDDFNAPTIDKGPRASTVLAIPYERETKGSGLIFSGIYNSTSGVNNTNQFIQAEAITKDLNQAYGTIQKLHTRDNNLLVCCEDKILKVYSNKDALYNADGSANLVSSNKVLGTSDPFAGEYGISLNPESFVAKEFRAYFTDKNRGAVIRLSADGITPISMHGMEDYFRDELQAAHTHFGSYDDKKQLYNLTLVSKFPKSHTISFSEKIKGWTSRMSFIPETGVSLNNEYYTFYNGEIWLHHSNNSRGTFYGTSYDCSVRLLLNGAPEIIKSFKTLNYEGTQSKVGLNLDDSNYVNNFAKDGWYNYSIFTDMQEGEVGDFVKKENKWFNFIRGKGTSLSNLDTTEISVQGLGRASVTGDTRQEYNLTITQDTGYDGVFFNEGVELGPPNNTGNTYTYTYDSQSLGNINCKYVFAAGVLWNSGNPLPEYPPIVYQGGMLYKKSTDSYVVGTQLYSDINGSSKFNPGVSRNFVTNINTSDSQYGNYGYPIIWNESNNTRGLFALNHNSSSNNISNNWKVISTDSDGIITAVQNYNSGGCL
jgi:hypothetical protein